MGKESLLFSSSLKSSSKIAVLVASQGENLKLAHKLLEVAKKENFDAALVDLVDMDLPLYSEREEEKAFPSKALKLKDLLVQADALAVIAPEYNGGVPPSLVNAVAWVSRTPDSNWREGFNKKPTMLASCSGGSGRMLLSALRLQLSCLGAHIIGRDISGNHPDRVAKELQECLADLALSFQKR